MRLRAALLFRLVLIVFILLILLSLPINPYTCAEPCAILQVSLPGGTYVGPNPDSWLSDCWQLTSTGLSQTFTVMINNTSTAKRSHDTRLVIALNDIGYNSLQSLIVNGTSISKSAFRPGRPQPYNLWDWPSGDVYPAWFEDTLVNVGTIYRKNSKSLVVSATFANMTGIRMHFDAYGSRVIGAPRDPEYITRNGISEDSTVLLNTRSPPGHIQPPIADFFFTPSHPTSYQSVTFNASDSYDPDGYIACYRWDFGDGTPVFLESDSMTTHYYMRGGSFAVGLTVTDNEGYWDTESKVITVTQTVSCLRYLSVKTNPEGITTIPGEGFYEHGTSVNLNAPLYVPDANDGDGQRYRFDHWEVDCLPVSGNPIDILMTSNHTAKAQYILQYLITFTHVGLDNTASGTIAAVNGTLKNFSDFPFLLWTDTGSSTTYFYDAAIPSTIPGKRFTLDHVGGLPSPIIVTGPGLVTGHYRVQYSLTITATTGGSTNPLNGGWFDAGTQVTVLAMPDPDYTLDHWELDGAPSGSISPCTVIMNSVHTLHAVFDPLPLPEYYLTVRTDPLGVASIPGEGFYDGGSDAVLTASGYVGLSIGSRYRFDYWDVDGIQREEGITTITVHMDASHTATAHYTLQYYLTVETTPSGIATIPGEGWYDTSVTVPLTAPNVEGYAFWYWDVDGVSQGSMVKSITILMCAPRTATANYQPIFVGGTSTVIESPSLTAWVSLNSFLAATIVAARFWVRRRRRKDV